NGIPVHIPKHSGNMIKKIAFAAALFALGYLIHKQQKKSKGLNKVLAGRLGSLLKISALGALGAAAPASPSLPSIPLVPMI
ncbi:MAG: hypothetical protein ACXWB9_01450, partial [Flavisolibacter sp.]